MNFFELPLVQNTNQVAYATTLGLIVAGTAWTLLRYCGSSFVRAAARRRQIRLTDENNRLNALDRRREIEIADEKREQERKEKKRQQQEAERLRVKKEKEEEEEKRKKAQVEDEVRLVTRIAEVVKAAIPPASQLLQAQELQPIRALNPPFVVGRIARFVRTSVNSAHVTDPTTGELRVAKKGDLITIKRLQGADIIVYDCSPDSENFAKMADLEVIG